jgi:hypothetical protein
VRSLPTSKIMLSAELAEFAQLVASIASMFSKFSKFSMVPRPDAES